MTATIDKLDVGALPLAPKNPLPIRQALSAARVLHTGLALLSDAGRRCGFDVLNIPSVPGLEQGNYADEMHVNASGVPLYTRYLVSKPKR